MRAGELVGARYRLEKKIGSGGMGVVWRAVDEKLGRVVALKRALAADNAQDSWRARQIRREAKIVALLNHPNVVTLHDLVDHDGELWLVMEYLPTRSLAEIGTLPAEQVARIGAQLAGALEAVHAAGVVHRDVKPSNVLVTEDGRAKLTDFGISRANYGDTTLAHSVEIAGTPGYLAPEVADGADATSASDVFSLGATLFTALEGVSPVGSAGNPLVLVRRAANGEIATPHRGGELSAVLSALLRRKPSRRPDAARARQLLEEIVARPRNHDRPISASTIAAAVITVVVLGSAAGSAPPRPAGPGARSRPEALFTIGEPRTADPCALTSTAELARFGDTEPDNGYGNFNQCHVFVRTRAGATVDVIAQLDPSTTKRQYPGKTEEHGALTIVRHQPTDIECSRTILLADRTHVVLRAQVRDHAAADLCPMADAATTSAMAVLVRGVFPRRTTPFADTSLAQLDACALVDPGTLGRFPGVDALRPEIGFGGWECRWRSTTISATLLVIFKRSPPLTAEDGRPTRFGGREAYVKPGGYGVRSCVARIVHREYSGLGTRSRFELLEVVILSPLPPEELCRMVNGIAGPIAANLPPA
ncbi:serine/threonine-protein kinase [Amycolatopsis samaneae]|uniref:non-specific serine/threonine protein kinase n=1 Tax=Amycolatopsis samaneae TaxID=664691 RepID=A0ABW5GNI8_9PSEU